MDINITLSQADQLKALCHYYNLSPKEVIDWSIKILWAKQTREELGLITLLEFSSLISSNPHK